MKQAVLTVSALCMLAAVCGQLMNSRRYANALRLVLGLEIFRVTLALFSEYMPMLN